MNWKEKVVFGLWVGLIVLVIGFMIFYVIKTQIGLNKADIDLVNTFFKGGLK